MKLLQQKYLIFLKLLFIDKANQHQRQDWVPKRKNSINEQTKRL